MEHLGGESGMNYNFWSEGKVGKLVTEIIDKFPEFKGFGPMVLFKRCGKVLLDSLVWVVRLQHRGFLLTEEMVDLKKIGLDEAGPFKTLFKNIKAFLVGW